MARFTNKTRKNQIEQVTKKFKQTNPKDYQIAVKKYQVNHPELNKATSAIVTYINVTYISCALFIFISFEFM